MATDMEKYISDGLFHAAELISLGHARGVFAQNANNQGVHYRNTNACKFCAAGAVRRAFINLETTETTTKLIDFTNAAVWEFAEINLAKELLSSGFKGHNNDDLIYSWSDEVSTEEVVNTLKKVAQDTLDGKYFDKDKEEFWKNL